jgi:hypothetical protein
MAEAIARRPVAGHVQRKAMRDVDLGWIAAMAGFALSSAFILAILAA